MRHALLSNFIVVRKNSGEVIAKADQKVGYIHVVLKNNGRMVVL